MTTDHQQWNNSPPVVFIKLSLVYQYHKPTKVEYWTRIELSTPDMLANHYISSMYSRDAFN